uniref:Phosphate-binding protein n=1 Tax=uncultured bacterium contig00016 TaxID=1181507 RepID=A0A806K0L4_9BACT|nr:phosphate ABC transporter, periplasmic phosphate-binding protein PstS (TC 3.A.1.7.1) [uncultured bacterium contig00016]
MKKFLFAGMLLAASMLAAQVIKGSDTVLPLSQQEAESFMKVNKNAKVAVTGGGSGVGINALIEGTTDIAQSSRKIKFDERKKIQDKGASFAVKEVVIAYDALAVVVHPGNQVSNLTREQLEGIFTGKITNWKEVGGADLKIVPYSRETSSGTYEFFKEEILQKKDYMAGILSMPATGAIVQSIKQTPGAIGYIGLAYLSKDIKAIKISYDGGKTYVEPSVKTAKDETYPVVRPLIYYYTAGKESAVKPFIDFVLSPAGQKIVADIGFVTVK